MAVTLPPLPFEAGALEPHMSRRTLELHYGKHHRHYVEALNELIADTPYDSRNLEEIVLTSGDRKPLIFNNAAQAWNHGFFWNCLTAGTLGPSDDFVERIAYEFESWAEFKTEFNSNCQDLFGSGWVWLVKDTKGNLKIRSLSNAGNPLLEEQVPLLTCDVWEHAYYLDCQNERMKFVENFWNIVNWPFVESNLAQEQELEKPRRRHSLAEHERSTRA